MSSVRGCPKIHFTHPNLKETNTVFFQGVANTSSRIGTLTTEYPFFRHDPVAKSAFTTNAMTSR